MYFRLGRKSVVRSKINFFPLPAEGHFLFRSDDQSAVEHLAIIAVAVAFLYFFSIRNEKCFSKISPRKNISVLQRKLWLIVN